MHLKSFSTKVVKCTNLSRFLYNIPENKAKHNKQNVEWEQNKRNEDPEWAKEKGKKNAQRQKEKYKNSPEFRQKRKEANQKYYAKNKGKRGGK